MTKKWLNKYPIAHEDHANGLEARAALAEWIDKLPRHEAEQAAHNDYKKEQHEDAAASHYNGMHMAHSSGDADSAKRHGIMYLLHLKALGHKDSIKPPPEVENKAKNNPHKLYKFKAHPSDSFVLQDNEGSKNES